MRTIADADFDRGVRRGVKKGLEKGRQALSFSLNVIIQSRFGRKVPAAARSRLAEADAATLERWIKRAAKARTLDAVFN